MIIINFKTLKEFVQIFYHKIIPRFIRARLSPLIHPPKLSKLIIHDKIDTYFEAYIKEITNNKNNNYKNNYLHKAFNKNMVRSDKIDVRWWSDFISLATLPNGLRFKQLNQSLINRIEYSNFNSLEYFELLHIYSLCMRLSLFDLAYNLRKKSVNLALQQDTSVNLAESWKIKAKLSALLEAGSFLKFDKIFSKFKSRWKEEKFLLSYLRIILKNFKKSSTIDKIIRMDSIQDQNYRNFIENKKIVIVGPSKSNKKDGKKIDNADVVIRINAMSKSSIGDPAIKGSRCDVTFFNGDQTTSIVKYGCLQWPNDITWVVGKEYGHAKEIIKRLSLDKINTKKLRGRGLEQVEPALFNGALNVLPNILIDLMRFNPKEIFLYHFDIMLTKERFAGYYIKEMKNKIKYKDQLIKIRTRGLAGHDPITQFIILKKFWKNKFLKGDKRFKEVIEMNIEDYIKELQKNYRNSKGLKSK